MYLNKYGAPNIKVLTLEETFIILDRKYGNLRLIVQGIISKLDKLESHPSNRKQEAKNIQNIINGMNELKNHGALAEFSDFCIKRYLKKIRYTTYHVDWSLEKLQDEFIM